LEDGLTVRAASRRTGLKKGTALLILRRYRIRGYCGRVRSGMRPTQSLSDDERMQEYRAMIQRRNE
jgi:transposase